MLKKLTCNVPKNDMHANPKSEMHANPKSDMHTNPKSYKRRLLEPKGMIVIIHHSNLIWRALRAN